jgi:mono/diheme cytochrome c family protein
MRRLEWPMFSTSTPTAVQTARTRCVAKPGRSSMAAILSALAAVAVAAPLVRAQTPAPEGNEQNGKRLFAAYYCSACHGTLGQGGAAGARIAPKPIAFAAFQKYLRQPAGQMAPYTVKVLPDRDLADIYAFLKSIPAAAAAKSIPLLSQ